MYFVRKNNSATVSDRGAAFFCVRDDQGYTLIELMFVVFILALLMSISMPKLMPAMLSSQLEGAARHIANYGRSAVAYSATNHEPIAVRFDLVNREYYCLKWSEDQYGLASGMESAGLSGIEGKNNAGLTLPEDKQANGLNTGTNSDLSIRDLIATGTAEDLEANREEVQYELDRSFERSMIAQARSVPQQSLLDTDDMLEKEFSLSTEEERDQREEVQDVLLEHGYLPDEIVIESVMISGELFSEGVVDIEITPIGLSEQVAFILKGPKDEYFTVEWDPITGGAHMVRGKEIANVEPAF
ncbi:MAG: prepilin-type N-terminal cleavage/methylation domain-containing protein [Candidatus Hydrogenedentes bacterium]|nr:prepilin-type N-terminal cleavage/methylation domain-containing protein [Candidatus Hydrogenedentota bacterium]